jgi:hypothetical protein
MIIRDLMVINEPAAVGCQRLFVGNRHLAIGQLAINRQQFAGGLFAGMQTAHCFAVIRGVSRRLLYKKGRN